MATLLGYDAEVVLRDERGRRLYIDAVAQGQAIGAIDLERVNEAVQQAESVSEFGDTKHGPGRYWRVEKNETNKGDS